MMCLAMHGKRRAGYALILTVFISMLLGGIIIIFFEMIATLTLLERRALYQEQAYRAAELAFQRAIQRIGHNPNYIGTSSETVSCGSSNLSCRSQWTVSGTYPNKTITAVGEVFNSSSNVRGALKTIRTTITVGTTGYTINTWDVE